MKHVTFDELLGKTAILCAVDGTSFRLGDLTLMAVEDKSDGYRSSLSHLEVVSNIRPTFKETVKIQSNHGTFNSKFKGLFFVNDLGKCVLQVGTKHYDDYYPCFAFQFDPTELTCNQPSIDDIISNVSDPIV